MSKTPLIFTILLIILTYSHSYFLKQTSLRGDILVELEGNKGLVIPFSYDIIKTNKFEFNYDLIFLDRQIEESDKSNVYFHLKLSNNQIIRIKDIIELDFFSFSLKENSEYSIEMKLLVEDQIIISSIMNKLGLVRVK